MSEKNALSNRTEKYNRYRNKFYSFQLGELPLGCQYCVKGEKLVLFITGICPRNCAFCPVSDQKYQQDVICANERPVKHFQDVLSEAEKMQARGAGITGGDPLTKLDRTIEYIKQLKKHFGKSFHIHLYTSLNLVTEPVLQQLFEAGLDEIRFHLDLDDTKFWPRLSLARKFSWQIGVEIPLIPFKEQETKNLIDFVHDKIDFLNLNELETADTRHYRLSLATKDQLSYAVKGSLEIGLSLLEYVQAKRYQLPVHLCTAKLKDAVQLAERLKREAQGAKHNFDFVDAEGLLTRGALYLEELKPGFGYREKLANDHTLILKRLEPLLQQIQLKFPKEEFYLDSSKPRILCAKKLVKKEQKFFTKLGLIPAIVTEYPTADQLEIEVEFV